MARMVAIYLYDEVEVLDFAGPYEVFSTASRVHQRRHPEQEPPFSVSLVASSRKLVSARGGFRVKPDYTLESCPPPDVIVIPGGEVGAELENEQLTAWINARHESAELVASICTGAFLLARSGLLDGKTVTTHWEDLDDLAAMFPHLNVVSDQRWVEQGRLVTSAGISAGIDMSLGLVARLEGEELAERTARQMDYRWQRHG